MATTTRSLTDAAPANYQRSTGRNNHQTSVTLVAVADLASRDRRARVTGEAYFWVTRALGLHGRAAWGDWRRLKPAR